MLNMEPVYGRVGVGDVVTDTGFVSGVDHLSIATGFTLDVDPSFVEPEFMPKYEATFRDECAEENFVSK
jgi:hypothetical protein